MKTFFQQKPWYFACVVLSGIAGPIFEWFVMYFFDESTAEAFLQKELSISDIIPWAVAGIILFVCMGVYIVQKTRSNSKIVSSEELDALNQTLFAAVDENEYIESMQAFQHREKNSQGCKYIKLNYIAGAANERIEINTILQTYFYFSYPMYKKIQNVSSRYNKYLKETDPIQKQVYKTDFQKAGNELCNQILDILNSIDCDKNIDEFHCDMYRVLAKLLPTISGVAIEGFLQRKDIENAIIKRKKTGILSALVINDLYIFRNQTSVAKSKRIYFVFPYSTKKDIVLLGSIDGEYFTDDELGEIEDYCKQVVTRICGSHKVEIGA